MYRTRSDFLAPVRLLLLSLGLAAVWIVISFFVGIHSAHADDGDSRPFIGSAVVVNVAGTPRTDAAPPAAETAVVPAVRSAVTDVVHAATAKAGSRIVAPEVESAGAVAAPVAATVAAEVAPVITPAADVLEPVISPVVAPTLDAVAAVVEPVISPVVAAAAPVVHPVVAATAPVVHPVVAVVTPVVSPVVAELTPATGAVAPELAESPPQSSSVALAGPDDRPTTVLSAAQQAASASPSLATQVRASTWAANLNSGLGVSPAASARPYPDPVPRGPADNGKPAFPSTLGAGGASLGGSASPSAAAEISSSFTLMLVSGALLSRAENDTLPSPLPLELSSTPD